MRTLRIVKSFSSTSSHWMRTSYGFYRNGSRWSTVLWYGKWAYSERDDINADHLFFVSLKTTKKKREKKRNYKISPLQWPTTCHGKRINLAAKRKTSRKKEKPHDKKKKAYGKKENLTTKRKTSRQKEKPHGKKKTLRQKEKDSRQKEKPHGKKKKTRGEKKTSRQKEKDSRQNFFHAERTF